MEYVCIFRLESCRFERIGCPWRGPFHELSEHTTACTHPNKSGHEIIDSLALVDQKKADEAKLFSDIFTFLSFEKVTFSGMYGPGASCVTWLMASQHIILSYLFHILYFTFINHAHLLYFKLTTKLGIPKERVAKTGEEYSQSYTPHQMYAFDCNKCVWWLALWIYVFCWEPSDWTKYVLFRSSSVVSSCFHAYDQ